VLVIGVPKLYGTPTDCVPLALCVALALAAFKTVAALAPPEPVTTLRPPEKSCWIPKNDSCCLGANACAAIVEAKLAPNK
jgi:hypothetical protein